MQAPPPAAEPSLWSWFVGGSVGYLADSEEWMYTGHIGVDTPWNLGGWNVAIFGEVGYTEIDNDFMILEPTYKTTELTEVLPQWASVGTETEVIPLTLNVKFERPIAAGLNFYAGGGLGVALVDVSSTSLYAPYNTSNDDNVFTAQLFTGLDYNFCKAFEVFGGVRWMYFDDAKIKDITIKLNDDWLFELGARFNF